jgi:hypothetical protein
MNRVRAGYPGRLDDLATLRREPADTVCFLDKRSNRSLHHSSNSEQCSLVTFLLLFVFQIGCRGAIRTPVPGFKVQGPATRRPGITLSARLLSRTAHTTPPTHPRCGQVSCDPYAHDLQVRDGHRRDRSRVQMQAQFQILRVFNYLCAHNLVAARRLELPSQP